MLIQLIYITFWEAKSNIRYANQQLSPLNTKSNVEGKVQRPGIEDFVANKIPVGDMAYV